MSAERLAENLDGAELISYHSEANIVLAWDGRHGIHVYDIDGREVDYVSVGDFSNSAATIEQARAAMESYRER